jgi:hypothetical protein
MIPLVRRSLYYLLLARWNQAAESAQRVINIFHRNLSKKWQNFIAQITTINPSRFTTQITTTSPQKTTQFHPLFPGSPVKKRL